ncbi:hypothetical protein HJFPF1_08123 [Paramyrothecium foliicola]|nr:hypothetical protein HJFPF1_08123 [Paramyrothecium foliicola]
MSQRQNENLTPSRVMSDIILDKHLIRMVRGKFVHESNKAEVNLHRLLCHANLLDKITEVRREKLRILYEKRKNAYLEDLFRPSEPVITTTYDELREGQKELPLESDTSSDSSSNSSSDSDYESDTEAEGLEYVTINVGTGVLQLPTRLVHNAMAEITGEPTSRKGEDAHLDEKKNAVLMYAEVFGEPRDKLPTSPITSAPSSPQLPHEDDGDKPGGNGFYWLNNNGTSNLIANYCNQWF